MNAFRYYSKRIGFWKLVSSVTILLGLIVTTNLVQKRQIFQKKAAPTSTTLTFIHQDQLGSTAMVTDAAGQVISRKAYYPYGSIKASEGQSPTERGYTGQVSDTDQTGLLYYNARYYDPTIAKFTQADKAADTLNKYAYVGNNPIVNTDPSGNMIEGYMHDFDGATPNRSAGTNPNSGLSPNGHSRPANRGTSGFSETSNSEWTNPIGDSGVVGAQTNTIGEWPRPQYLSVLRGETLAYEIATMAIGHVGSILFGAMGASSQMVSGILDTIGCQFAGGGAICAFGLLPGENPMASYRINGNLGDVVVHPYFGIAVKSGKIREIENEVATLSKFNGSSLLPEFYEQLSPNSYSMEFINGVEVWTANYEKIHVSTTQVNDAVNEYQRLVLGGFTNADLNARNILVQPNGVIRMVDPLGPLGNIPIDPSIGEMYVNKFKQFLGQYIGQ